MDLANILLYQQNIGLVKYDKSVQYFIMFRLKLSSALKAR